MRGGRERDWEREGEGLGEREGGEGGRGTGKEEREGGRGTGRERGGGRGGRECK